ncbi:MAG: 2-amino-4-hydroxy-6-hydroxymethyldihydropteridine diphosphokinase [Patescibacteria group bacterium]
MAKAYVGIGSNKGDARAHIHKALEELKKIGTILSISSLYKTEPVGFAEQEWFLNCALLLETELSPKALLTAFKRIEKELGRTPSIKNGPREIDIDLLLYGETIIHTEVLTVPHSRMHERSFVLLPLSEIAPNVIHPIFKKTVAELRVEIHDTHACEKISDPFPSL